MEDLYGVTVIDKTSSGLAGLELHVVGRKRSKRFTQKVCHTSVKKHMSSPLTDQSLLESQDTDKIARWHQLISCTLAGVQPGGPPHLTSSTSCLTPHAEAVPRRHLLILVNPFGGTKKAPKVFL